MKTQRIPLPILNKSTKKYLSYEESKRHQDRQKEKLPSRNYKEKSKPKFKLSKNRARTTVNCTECKKPRVVYKVAKPTKKDLVNMENHLDEIIWTCGSSLGPEEYGINPNLSCRDGIEGAFYTELSDKFAGDLICCSCGELCSVEAAEHYLKLKEDYSTVRPTCEKMDAQKIKK